MIKTRTLSDTGRELFSMANPFSPKNCHKNKLITKMNSWTDIPLDSPQPSPRRKSTGCINFKSFNLKKIYLDLITTDFDKKLELNLKNMRNASKKLISYLYSKENTIPDFVNNAVTNLIILILSDGEKFLSKQKVKRNIHFYLKLAETAMKNNDHQTAILIKIALENFNITRLDIKYNKTETKIRQQLCYRYGGFKDCHSKHIREILDFYEIIHNDYNEKGIKKEYIPSAMILHMHTKKNKAYSKAFTRIGKYPQKLLDFADTIENLKKLYYNAFFGESGISLTKLYETDPTTLAISEKMLKNKNDCANITQLLFILSCNVKGVKNNRSDKIKESQKKWNRLKHCK